MWSNVALRQSIALAILRIFLLPIGKTVESISFKSLAIRKWGKVILWDNRNTWALGNKEGTANNSCNLKVIGKKGDFNL